MREDDGHMMFSLGLIFFFGLLGNLLFRRLKLPGLLGMLVVGVLLGPYVFNLLDDDILAISDTLRLFALIVILLRAGLGLRLDKIKAAGRPSVLLSFVPGVLEGMTIAFLAMWLLDFGFVQGGILGFIIAAVSPAVIVPSMLVLMEKKRGTNKHIPTMMLSATALDDVFAITFFSTFLGIYMGTSTHVGLSLLNIPLSILLGVLMGALLGYGLVQLFKKMHVRDSKKVVLILAFSFFLLSLETFLEDVVMFAALLSIMTIGIVITALYPKLGLRLSMKFNKIWVFAEIFLFVLIGAAVDITLAFETGLLGLFVIGLGLLARSVGVLLATMKTVLHLRERLFCVIAYWPKATVQAAIGAVPYSLGVEGGDVMLALAVLSIVITAPLGAWLIRLVSVRWLDEETA